MICENIFLDLPTQTGLAKVLLQGLSTFLPSDWLKQRNKGSPAVTDRALCEWSVGSREEWGRGD